MERTKRPTKTGYNIRVSRDHYRTIDSYSLRSCYPQTTLRVLSRSDRVRSTCVTPLQVYPIWPRYYQGFATRHHRRPIPLRCSTCFLEESALRAGKRGTISSKKRAHLPGVCDTSHIPKNANDNHLTLVVTFLVRRVCEAIRVC